MMKTFGPIAAAFVLAGTVTAAAQITTTTVIEQRGPNTIVERRAPVVLTPEQRTVIYQSVVREPVATDVQVTRGARLPSSVELRALPERVYTEVPVVKLYKYVYVQGQVVLVDPDTSEVVDVIAR
jgi:hypothetical protein